MGEELGRQFEAGGSWHLLPPGEVGSGDWAFFCPSLEEPGRGEIRERIWRMSHSSQLRPSSPAPG